MLAQLRAARGLAAAVLDTVRVPVGLPGIAPAVTGSVTASIRIARVNALAGDPSALFKLPDEIKAGQKELARPIAREALPVAA